MLVKKEVDGIETAALHCIHTVHDLSGSEGTLVNSNTGSAELIPQCLHRLPQPWKS